jgi:signal transduction histidine kinase/ActR/RegA family two-component response regulator
VLSPIKFRTYLGCLVAAVLLPVLGLATYLSIGQTINERRSVEQGMRETAHALSLAVDGKVTGAMASLDALVASTSFRAGDYTAFRPQAEQFVLDHGGWLSIVDEDGQQHLNTQIGPDAPLPKTADTEWLRNMFAAPFYITGAISRPPANEPFVAISRRSLDPDGKAVALTYAIAPDVLSNVLLRQRLPAAWYGVITDRDGIVIGRTRVRELIGRRITVLPTPPNGFTKARTHEGDDVYLAWSTSELSNWSTGVAAPSSVIDDLLTSTIIRVDLLSLLALILAVSAAAYLGHLVTRPMTELAHEVLASAPHEPAAFRPAPVKEINTLTAAYRRKVAELLAAIKERDAARAKLQAWNQDLEQRVIERSAEMERLNEHLFQLQKQESIGRLTGGIAHDFNNLLAAILGNLELLAKRLEDHPAAKYVTNARAAAKRGAELTGQLLAFSRRQHLEPKPVDVNASIHGTAELLRSTLGGNIRLEVVDAKEPRIALADRTQLELVVLNLAVNARDAMPMGGTITLQSYHDTVETADDGPQGPAPGHYTVVAVTDTGTGMTEEVRARALEPFFTTKPLGKGSGLGLAHVLGVTKQLGGGIRIKTKPGAGTRVEIFLPHGSVTPDEPAPAIARDEGGHAHARILLVDDDADVRLAIVALLTELGCAVTEVGSGSAAVEVFERNPTGIDMALIDFSMPGMNGSETATRLHHLAPDLPIIIVTGYADSVQLTQSWHGSVLQKPFDLEQLVDALGAVRPASGTSEVRMDARA